MNIKNKLLICCHRMRKSIKYYEIETNLNVIFILDKQKDIAFEFNFCPFCGKKVEFIEFAEVEDEYVSITNVIE